MVLEPGSLFLGMSNHLCPWFFMRTCMQVVMFAQCSICELTERSLCEDAVRTDPNRGASASAGAGE